MFFVVRAGERTLMRTQLLVVTEPTMPSCMCETTRMMMSRRSKLGVLALALSVALSCTSADVVPPAGTKRQVPRVIHRVNPDYPAELREQRVEGVVVVSGVIPKEGGTIRNPRVVRTNDPRLNALALDAVSRWIWAAGLENGEPVDVEFTTEVRFALDR
jgi:TonB family protein